MRRQLFIYTILIIFTGLIVFFSASVYITRTNNFNIAKGLVIEITEICAGLYCEEMDINDFVAVGSDTRITVISPDGGVLADSRPLDVNKMDDHLTRPEVQAALNGAPAANVRYSDTLGVDLIYYALKVDSEAVDGDYVFVRAAVPVAEVNSYIYQSLSLLIFILLILAVLCFMFIRNMADRITKPFSTIEQKLRSLSSGEYTSEQIEAGNAGNSHSYEEIDRITRGIDEISLVLQVNAKRREEFFANASHELKTPLTAIKGFNELTAINNEDESICRYINSITRETDRMLSLIGDMLKLSELENSDSINPVSVSIADIISEVSDTMSTAINEKSITLKVEGDASVTAEQGHVYELVKNLIENAVRYNNQDGEVTVVVEKDRLTVSDNGIGIPPEDRTRIFERFYRVEKSRSGVGGGTGLGLSIVKHICTLYDWKLSLKSEVGVGTRVIVEI
jgi:two-component system phosphate regulon sensor histidine kinase PhoR